MAKTNLERLKEKLPPKWAVTLNAKTGLSKSYIYKVLDGEKQNVTIIREAKTLAEEHVKELKSLGIYKSKKR